MKVLVTTDGSDDSLEAAEFLAELVAENYSIEVHLIFVKELSGTTAVGAGVIQDVFVLPPSFVRPLEEASQHALDSMETALATKGIVVKSKRSEWGHPADTVCRVADADGMDLIVVGSRGIGGLTGLLLGSVSSRIVLQAHCPVLVVR